MTGTPDELYKRLELILEAAGEGIYGLDTEGRTTFVNPAAQEMLQYRVEELLGESMHAVLHHSHPDGSPYDAKGCPIYLAFKDGRVHTVDDEVFWRKDGSSFPVEYTSTPIRDGGRLMGAVVVFRDLSEIKKTQDELRRTLVEVESLKDRLEAENVYLHEAIRQEHNFSEILGESPAIHRVLEAVATVAPTDANVVISGETGCGKELVARAVHCASERRDKTLIKVNCASIPRDLFESEFFGHVRGSFTGAVKDRAGRFELANGETLFLDEVGEIPLETQSKLLRVLQEGRFERVGDERTRTVDVRILAATNRDLEQEGCSMDSTRRPPGSRSDTRRSRPEQIRPRSHRTPGTREPLRPRTHARNPVQRSNSFRRWLGSRQETAPSKVYSHRLGWGTGPPTPVPPTGFLS